MFGTTCNELTQNVTKKETKCKLKVNFKRAAAQKCNIVRELTTKLQNVLFSSKTMIYRRTPLSLRFPFYRWKLGHIFVRLLLVLIFKGSVHEIFKILQ